MSAFSDFVDDVLPSAVAAVGAFLVPGGGLALAGKVFATNLVLGGVQRALAKDPESAGLGRAADRTVTSREPVAPRRIVYGKVRLGGTYVYMHTTDDESKLHLVIPLCEGPVEGIDEIYFNDEIAVEADGTIKSKYSSVLTVSKVLGSTSQAADSTATNLTPDTGNGAWTSDHRGRGVAYIYLALDFNRDKWPQGVPRISAVVRGRNTIWDPRDGTTKYTDNSALCLADYLLDDRFGLNLSQSDIDSTDLQAAANTCDESVSLKDGGTESRYTTNGVVVSSEKPKNIIADLANAMAGWATNIGGVWYIRAGEYRSPVMTLNEDNLRSGIEFTSRASKRERFNSVRGTFVAPENDWQPADFPPWQSSSEITEDGETIWKDIELPYTTSPSMATRLARIEVERMRREQMFSARFDLSALQLVAGDTFQFTYDRFGFSQKVFEVVDLQPVGEDGAFAVDVQAREFDSNVYDWSSTDEGDVTQAPETDLPDPFTVNAPTGLTLASGTGQLFVKKDGTVVSRIKATWNQSSGAFVDRYQVQYKQSADSDWTNAGDVDDDNRIAYAWDVEDDVSYDVRVRAVNQLGVRSSYTTVTGHTVIGKTEPPPDPDTFDVVVEATGRRQFSFTLANEPADLAGFEIRFTSGSSTDWDAMDRLTPQGRLVASPWDTNEVPSGLHSFGIKAVDTSGNKSTNALFIEQDLPNPQLAGVLVQRKEKGLGWPGTITAGFVDTNDTLQSRGDTWDDLGTETWDSYGTDSWYVAFADTTDLVYETPEIDLGVDSNFTPRVTLSVDGTATIEMKTGTEADGSVTGSYTALNDVEGARYVQIRVTVSGTGTAINSMTTLIDGAIETTGREDVNTATESAAWFERIAAGHFRVAANDDTGALIRASITAIQGITSRHWWSLESKNATVTGNSNPAAEFKVYDSTDTLADVTIDVRLEGPKKAS